MFSYIFLKLKTFILANRLLANCYNGVNKTCPITDLTYKTA